MFIVAYNKVDIDKDNWPTDARANAPKNQEILSFVSQIKMNVSQSINKTTQHTITLSHYHTIDNVLKENQTLLMPRRTSVTTSAQNFYINKFQGQSK